MNKNIKCLSEKELSGAFHRLKEDILSALIGCQHFEHKIYGVPRGGIPVVYRLEGSYRGVQFIVTDNPAEADVIVDDIECSGRTRASYKMKFNVPFCTLIKKEDTMDGTWFVFPWEGSVTSSADDICTRLLEFIGEDCNRDGLLRTPERFIKSWQFLTSGYHSDPKQILGTRFDNDEGYNEMVILRDIEFYSMCEHHLLPFYGKVHIAYIPKDKVVGISKLSRLVECFARRLQIQERLTEQIAGTIEQELQPSGVAVMVEARHLCMMARGVQKQDAMMVTSALKGTLEEEAARLEFLLLKRG